MYYVAKMSIPLPKCPHGYQIGHYVTISYSNGVDSDEFCHTQLSFNAIGDLRLNRPQTSDNAYNVF